MKVYIQQALGQFEDDWVFAAYLGFSKLGATIKFFENIDTVPCLGGKNMVVVTGIENSIKYFETNNIEIPLPFNIPVELNNRHFLGEGREINYMSLKDFKALKQRPIFVKPNSRVKEFPSGVVSKTGINMDLLFLGTNENTEVMTSTVVDMASEYRCFIYDGKLVGMKHYQGDFTLYPDVDLVKEAIKKYKSAPIAYTIDVAIIPENKITYPETIIIECQDFWAIGNYGFDDKLYAQMLRDRWFEIVNN